MTDDDRVFKALADPTRRFLLDLLFRRDGRTLTELESELEMTRFGVAKHLKVLADADLVVVRRSGREKLHFHARRPGLVQSQGQRRLRMDHHAAVELGPGR